MHDYIFYYIQVYIILHDRLHVFYTTFLRKVHLIKPGPPPPSPLAPLCPCPRPPLARLAVWLALHLPLLQRSSARDRLPPRALATHPPPLGEGGGRAGAEGRGGGEGSGGTGEGGGRAGAEQRSRATEPSDDSEGGGAGWPGPSDEGGGDGRAWRAGGE